jgi:uncharacterized protein (TIGR04255 family)
MPFPDASRVLYERNPIDEVICQLRFPSVLKLEVEPPAAFQDLVRQRFPIYQSKATLRISGLPPQLADLVAKELPVAGHQTAHEFRSRDENWKLSLTRDFLALTCRQYEQWESFKEALEPALAALVSVYAPSFLTRIGLRYRDVFRRSRLGLAGHPWKELLQPWIAGAFVSVPESDIEHTANELVVRLPEHGSQVRVQHGILTPEGADEQCYLLDADFFVDQQTEINHAIQRLDYLNYQARLLLRWCIQPRLHDAMGPRPA